VKYVALLAFNKIVITHPYLVAQQEDVIMDCIDSPDMSIRLRALDLVVGMVSSDNLMSIVSQLMRQLRNSPQASYADKSEATQATAGAIVPLADSDDEDPQTSIRPARNGKNGSPLLPDDYRNDVIIKILEMCSSSNYSNLMDFEWYIDILIQLVRVAPVPNSTYGATLINSDTSRQGLESLDVAEKVGNELRNVAVKVKALRPNATRAAESILIAIYNGTLSQPGVGKGALRPVAWIVGEFSSFLKSPENALTALLYIMKNSTSSEALSVYLQAAPKIFAFLAGNERSLWTSESKTMISLLMARMIHSLEPLIMHPDLEVQERSVEFIELLRLAAEASAGQEPSTENTQQDPPLLLTQAIPSLFSGFELNSISFGAQRNVPISSSLDLDQPINSHLNELLRAVESSALDGVDHDDFEVYYHQAPQASVSSLQPALYRLTVQKDDVVSSYQQGGEDSYLDPDIVARRRAERLERNKDDPFYIPGSGPASNASTPLHNIIRSGNGTDLDLDSIPIMKLDLGNNSAVPDKPKAYKIAESKPRQRIQVAMDETLGTGGTSTPGHEDSETSLEGLNRSRPGKQKHSLLLVDSSNIGAFSLQNEEKDGVSTVDYERQQFEEAEMAKAMKEVERLRLEMQRANERIQAAHGVPPEGTVVKKKTKKKAKPVIEGEEEVKSKRKKLRNIEDTVNIHDVTAVIKKKKPKKKVNIEVDPKFGSNGGNIVGAGAEES